MVACPGFEPTTFRQRVRPTLVRHPDGNVQMRQTRRCHLSRPVDCGRDARDAEIPADHAGSGGDEFTEYVQRAGNYGVPKRLKSGHAIIRKCADRRSLCRRRAIKLHCRTSVQASEATRRTRSAGRPASRPCSSRVMVTVQLFVFMWFRTAFCRPEGATGEMFEPV